MTHKPTVLILVGTYLPGFRGGGPIQSIANLIDWLGDEINFRVIASDRDTGDNAPYPGIQRNAWVSVGKALVFYLDSSSRFTNALVTAITEPQADVIYLNSFFSFRFSILPLVLRHISRIPGTPIILAPRGELCPGALQLKAPKKRLFLTVARLLRLYDDICWQATSVDEERDLRILFGPKARIVNLPNLPPRVTSEPTIPPHKEVGSLSLAFLSRISPKKNLLMALEVLDGVQGNITFSIYGPIEDREYWAQCEARISKLSSNISVKYCGEVPHEEVSATLRQHHAFLFPTLSENFGHAILEAFNAGLLVITSDQTPWRNLEQAGVGWDLPLSSVDEFRRAINLMSSMNEEEFQTANTRARLHSANTLRLGSVLEKFTKLFSRSARNSNDNT